MHKHHRRPVQSVDQGFHPEPHVRVTWTLKNALKRGNNVRKHHHRHMHHLARLSPGSEGEQKLPNMTEHAEDLTTYAVGEDNQYHAQRSLLPGRHHTHRSGPPPQSTIFCYIGHRQRRMSTFTKPAAPTTARDTPKDSLVDANHPSRAPFELYGT
jgi:hypothetical protein